MRSNISIAADPVTKGCNSLRLSLHFVGQGLCFFSVMIHFPLIFHLLQRAVTLCLSLCFVGHGLCCFSVCSVFFSHKTASERREVLLKKILQL